MRYILLIFITIFLSSCSSGESGSSIIQRHKYEEVENITISYLDVFNIEEERYYLYFFQTTCAHCLEIKDRMIEFALSEKEKIYFVEIKKDEGFLSESPIDTLYTSDPLKAFSKVTPQLSLVEEGMITNTVIGKEEILLIIE